MPEAAVLAQFLKALLDKGGGCVDAVIEGMQPDVQERFAHLPERSERPLEAFFPSYKTALAPLHPSWYEELVPFVAEELRPCMRQKLAEGEETPLRSFLLTYLVKKWPDHDIPDIKEVGETPFRFLLECDHEVLLRLQELIVVYDVVDEVRQIVDKNALQQVLKYLSSLQQKYLRSLLHRTARVPTSTFGLARRLRQNPEKAEEIIRCRGLEQFVSAISGESKPFLWYFFHRIERQEASKIQSAMDHKTSANEQAVVRKRFIEAYRFLQMREKV